MIITAEAKIVVGSWSQPVSGPWSGSELRAGVVGDPSYGDGEAKLCANDARSRGTQVVFRHVLVRGKPSPRISMFVKP